MAIGREIQLSPKAFEKHINGLSGKMFYGEIMAKKKIGEEGVKSIDKNFKMRSWQGSPWQKRNDSKPHPLLEKTGRLRRSIQYRGDSMGINIGSPLHYSEFQNSGNPDNRLFGSKAKYPIPPRPFIGYNLVYEKLVQLILYKMMEYTFSNSMKSILFR